MSALSVDRRQYRRIVTHRRRLGHVIMLDMLVRVALH
jgi:hypothetical protein